MKFELPKADRTRLDQLLEYLGDRADDFKKCFDIESEWCWKYADLMLRGLEKRELEYAEGHHIVPASFYGKRGCSKVDERNLTVLTYGEHLLAHYCLVWCATGKMQGKMASAFLVMYKIGVTGNRPIMPSESELLDAIPEMEIKRIQVMDPKWSKVEAEGRTHYTEDPKQYYKDYYEANKDKRIEYGKTYREANKEKVAEREKAHYEANKEKIAARDKAYREANKEKIAEYLKAYREDNKEKLAEYGKTYREDNKEKLAEYWKTYREDNKEKRIEYGKTYRANNKEKIAESRKAHYEANRENILEKKNAYRKRMKESGYKRMKIDGHEKWVFVGLPEQEVAA